VRSILITGCSSGIGHDAAHGMRRRGWRVFATCRRPADCERLQAEGLESFVLDLADEGSVAAGAAEALARTGGRLDALFNNGAFASPGLVEDLPRGAYREIFETNLFGQFDLIRQVLPAMRAQGHGRIVNNSSVLGFAALRFRGAYNATKFAMEGLTDTMRLELHGSGIHLILIEPGPVTSMIRAKSIPQFERWVDWKASAQRGFYERAALPRLYAQGGGKDRFELPASAVTSVLARALEADRPRARYRVTTPTKVMHVLKRLLPTRAMDFVARRV
jgi:NAD(P)-dependent dehydrogenase (short-subunit alcohol dehydrogenase family)